MVIAVRKSLSPLHLGGTGKRDVRTQFAALPYRIARGRPEILLITSRETGRWIIPKGWPEHGLTASDSAAREAWEEAGIEGRVSDTCLGIYSYLKMLDRRDRMPIVVAVFPIQVRRLRDDYPEKGQRKRKWFSRKKAAARVEEPELGLMLKGFDHERLHG
jgi:8-oxo-dGTP pyrophosphatase MutT (NUDIX family)